MHRMGASYLLCRRLRKAKMPHLSSRYEIGHSAYRLFDRDFRIDAVQDIDVYEVGSQSP